MKVIDLVRLLPHNTQIKVRGAFPSGWGEEHRPDFYNGTSQDFPSDSKYRNRNIICTYYWKNGTGDVCTIKDADGLDIAVADTALEKTQFGAYMNKNSGIRSK